MQVFKIGEFIILKGIKAAEPKFRERLSQLTISKYGKSTYPTDLVTEILYMYNSDIRIYTFEQGIDVITGKHTDSVFSCTIDEEDRNIYKIL